MPGRGQSVDARADDDIPAVSGDHGTCLPDLRRAAAQYLHKVARLCDHAQRGRGPRPRSRWPAGGPVTTAWLPRGGPVHYGWGTLDQTEIRRKATPWPANCWWRSATRWTTSSPGSTPTCSTAPPG